MRKKKEQKGWQNLKQKEETHSFVHTAGHNIKAKN